jgi:D-arabinose 1-dehydrogenase-like Zn-dependent alcohol dehydrogenase
MTETTTSTISASETTSVRAVGAPASGAPLGALEIQRRAIGATDVRIDIKFCGICHSDIHFVRGEWGEIPYPAVPGHEIAGVVAAVGAEVSRFAPGDRVGVGCMVNSCRQCENCRSGEEQYCLPGNTQTYGSVDRDGTVTYGGYSDHVVVDQDFVLNIPDGLELDAAAPLLCAGITTFNSLRESVARPGDLVAVLGVGGLGHLGVQYAAKMGFEVAAIARGTDKEPLAKKLGAHHYIDSKASDVAEELNKLGGAQVILATVTVADAMAATIGGLKARGELVVVGAPAEPMETPLAPLIFKSAAVQGHASGTSQDSEDTLRFSALTGVRPMIETVPLSDVQAAYDKMMSGAARFRMVLTMD